MSAKHTPGPWAVTYGHKTKLVRGIHAATRNVVNFNGLAAPASNESQANALLIAAAPELLRVLAMVRDTLPHIGGNEMSVHSMLHDINSVFSKATGEQQ